MGGYDINHIHRTQGLGALRDKLEKAILAKSVGGDTNSQPRQRTMPVRGGGGADTLIRRPETEKTSQFRVSPHQDKEEEVPPHKYSDDALADAFAERHRHHLRYVAVGAKWLHFDGRRWKQDDTLNTFNSVRLFCRGATEDCGDPRVRMSLASAKTIAAVEKLAKADQRLAATAEQWDADPWLLNTPSGVIDLRTGGAKPPCPTDYITKMTAVSPGGDCPLWKSFIERITNSDPELARYLQRAMGYSLTGVTREEALFFCYGTGANGKSVLLRTVADIVGSYHKEAAVETFTASKQERHPTELAGLRGARIVTCVETEQGRHWAEAKIKAVTSGEKIPARFMRQDFFEYTPQFKLIIAGNHKPGLRSVNEAIRRRFHLIPFAVTIPPEERDQQLSEKLKAEWPGILAWMIEGCLAWQRDGLSPPAAVREATDAYLTDEDAIGNWIGDACERDPQAWESSTELFSSWKLWAEGTGETVGSQKGFIQALKSRGLIPHRREGARGLLGLRVVENARS